MSKVTVHIPEVFNDNKELFEGHHALIRALQGEFSHDKIHQQVIRWGTVFLVRVDKKVYPVHLPTNLSPDKIEEIMEFFKDVPRGTMEG